MRAMATRTDDAIATLLLCSSDASARGDDARPLGPAGWAKVVRRLAAAGSTPGSLLGLDAVAVADLLGDLLSSADATARHLARSAQLAIELDRLAMRGIHAVTIVDDAYPHRLADRLADKAPPVLFTAGDQALLQLGGVAIIGSRDVDAAGAAFAAELGADAARSGLPVISGGARGVDQVAMRSAVAAGGRAVGLLPEGIERPIREPETRQALEDGVLVLASPYYPGAGFSAGAAMGRNKLIYALSDAAVVVASSSGTGGTWAGAEEALMARWVPVYVRAGDNAPTGNAQLERMGARPLAVPVVREFRRADPHEQTTLDWDARP